MLLTLHSKYIQSYKLYVKNFNFQICTTPYENLYCNRVIRSPIIQLLRLIENNYKRLSNCCLHLISFGIRILFPTFLPFSGAIRKSFLNISCSCSLHFVLFDLSRKFQSLRDNLRLSNR